MIFTKKIAIILLMIVFILGLSFSVYSEKPFRVSKYESKYSEKPVKLNKDTNNNKTIIIDKKIDVENSKISDNLKNKLSKNSKKINILVLTKKNNLDVKKDSVNKKYSSLGIYDLTLTKEDIYKLSKNSDVVYIDENKKIHSLMLEKSRPFFSSFEKNKNKYGVTGKGIKVAVIDTGIDENNDFLKDSVIKSVDFSYDGSASDYFGHGTHVSGIIKSIAPDVKLINVKVLGSDGYGTTSSVIAGIEYATKNKADILTLSLGSDQIEQDYFMNIALQKAIDNGAKVIVAAGNCGEDCISSPGNFENAITVGAIDSRDNVAWFSSGYRYSKYTKPDIVAPGVDINSTVLDNSFEEYSGTSMATPHITGIVALMLENNKNMPQYQVKKILESTATDKGEPGKDTRYGSGVPNLILIFETLKN